MITVYELLEKLDFCNRSWSVRFENDYSLEPELMFVRVDVEAKEYVIVQGCCGT